jgi:hypothetical protein
LASRAFFDEWPRSGGAFSFRVSLPEQFRQPGDVDGDPSRLVFREHLRLSSFVFVLARIGLRERLQRGRCCGAARFFVKSAPSLYWVALGVRWMWCRVIRY